MHYRNISSFLISSWKIEEIHPIYKEEREITKMEDRKLMAMLDRAEKIGIEIGIKIMQQRMLLACENGTPINIEGRVFFIKSDIQNLHDIFTDLEADAD